MKTSKIYLIVFIITTICFVPVGFKTSYERVPLSIVNMDSTPHISSSINWSANGVPICTMNKSQFIPQICSDGIGGAIIVWKDMRDDLITEDDIYIQRVNYDGVIQWTVDGTEICTVGDYQDDPQVCSDGVGGAIVVWEDNRDSGTSYSDIYAQRINSTGDIQWTPNGTAICTDNTGQFYPKICSDGLGGAMIVWEDYRNGMDVDLYAQRINSTGHTQWTRNGTIICNESGNQETFQLCSDGIGGAMIVWEDDRFFSSTGEDIYVQRINSTGDTQWTPNGAVICSADSNQRKVQLVSDGAGAAIITWEEKRDFVTTYIDIYAQRINLTGDIQWTVNGIEICAINDYQRKPQICSDGVGGVIIAWEDERDIINNEHDIYAQRVNNDGDNQWTANGIAVCTVVSPQINLQLVGDGEGGAIIAWEDERLFFTNDLDIYVQWINSTGDVRWTTDGVAVCEANNEQRSLQLCNDGLGGVIVVWEDNRGSFPTFSDIYAQRILIAVEPSPEPDPDPDPEPTPDDQKIPFDNFYLLFMLCSIIILIPRLRHKILKKK